MTQAEIAALIGLLNRIPMTPAEALWINALIARLALPAVPVQEQHENP